MDELDRQIPIERYDTLDSTSRYARRAVESGLAGDQARLIVAASQSDGMGRFGRRWASPVGGLWCTLIWPVHLEPNLVINGLGLRVGVACVLAVQHSLAAQGCGKSVQLKWPNDVLIEGRKAGGVLCEVIKRGARTYILVGIGINANNTIEDLPEEVRSIATTLHDEVGHDVNTDRLLRELRSGLRNALSSVGVDRHTVHSARKHLYGVDRPAEATVPEGKSVRGVLKGLDDAGCPIIQTAEGMFHAPVTCEVSTQPLGPLARNSTSPHALRDEGDLPVPGQPPNFGG